MPIKNLILDLGGVIINLDYSKTIAEFNKISQLPFEEIYSQAGQIKLFNNFDNGSITEQVFFEEIAQLIKYEGPAEILIKAWNAMLLDVPAQRLNLLLQLKNNYQTFLLSNTCETHIQAFEAELLKAHQIPNFEQHFNKVYYSCRMGLRKPDREIFEFVLRENNLNAEETIFIDDSLQHVKGAAHAGIEAHCLPQGMELKEKLQELNLL